jgi:hypothetical protein
MFQRKLVLANFHLQEIIEARISVVLELIQELRGKVCMAVENILTFAQLSLGDITLNNN